MKSGEYILVAKRTGRFIVVRGDDIEQPVAFESLGQCIAEWHVKDLENAIYLIEHPAAIVASGFHGKKSDGFDLVSIFSIEELRAAISILQP